MRVARAPLVPPERLVRADQVARRGATVAAQARRAPLVPPERLARVVRGSPVKNGDHQATALGMRSGLANR